MTIQHVNLYLPEFRPKKDWFSLLNLAIAAFVLFIVLVCVSYLQNSVAQKSRAKLLELENQKVALSNSIEAYKEGVDNTQGQKIDAKIAAMRARLAQRQLLAEVIQGQNLGNEAGFSPAWQAIANYSSSDFSISKIHLFNGGTVLHLAGETRKAQYIPEYLEKLQSDPTLGYLNFGALSMTSENSNRSRRFHVGYESIYQKGNVQSNSQAASRNGGGQ